MRLNHRTPVCPVHTLPERGCDDCEYYFCRDCAVELTTENASCYSDDQCYACEADELGEEQ